MVSVTVLPCLLSSSGQAPLAGASALALSSAWAGPRKGSAARVVRYAAKRKPDTLSNPVRSTSAMVRASQPVGTLRVGYGPAPLRSTNVSQIQSQG